MAMNNDGAVASTRVAGPFRYRVRTEIVDIAASDGVVLSLKLWMPEIDRPAGTVLEAIPYRKDDVSVLDDEVRFGYFAGHGYVCVRMDLRGSGTSGGVLIDEYSTLEQRDIVEVIEWIAAQPWSNGAVGMIGISWSGFNALQVAARRPKALKAVISAASTDDRYATDVHYLGGSPLGFYMNLWGSALHLMNMRPPRSDIGLAEDWRSEWLTRLRSNVDFTSLWLSHSRKDAYWQQGSVRFSEPGIACPVLMVGGWMDAYTDAAFRMLDESSAPVKALIGPWGHTWPERPEPGPGIDFLAHAKRWWDRWLLDEPNGVEDDPDALLYLQEYTPSREDLDHRPGRWLAIDAAADAVVDGPILRLHPDADGRLDAAPSTGEVVHTGSLLSGLHARHFLPMGEPTDLAVVQDEDDARSLRFELEIGEDGLDVVGAVRLTTAVRTWAKDAAVFVRLCDVDPEGHSHLVTWGNLNLAHRAGSLPDEVAPYVPGEPVEFTVALKRTAYRFAPGHRLRVAVSTGYWPWIWPTPDLVDLTVSLEHTTVVLPLLDAATTRDLEPGALGEPVIAPAPQLVDTGERRAFWEVDETVPGTVVVRKGGVGASATSSPEDGWTIGVLEDMAEFAIVEGDPLSASMLRRTAQVFRWDGHEAVVRLRSTMTADRQDFFVENRSVVELDGRRFFSQTTHQTIPRDHN